MIRNVILLEIINKKDMGVFHEYGISIIMSHELIPLVLWLEYAQN